MKARAAGLTTQVLVDTGPLVALLNASDHHHDWVVQCLARIRPPLITCEAVLAEATHLVRGTPRGRLALIQMVDEGFLAIGLQLSEQTSPLLSLLKRYVSVPMSLADACMVRLAELNTHSLLWTLDSDFAIYRRNGRHVISLIAPPPLG